MYHLNIHIFVIARMMGQVFISFKMGWVYEGNFLHKLLIACAAIGILFALVGVKMYSRLLHPPYEEYRTRISTGNEVKFDEAKSGFLTDYERENPIRFFQRADDLESSDHSHHHHQHHHHGGGLGEDHLNNSFVEKNVLDKEKLRSYAYSRYF
jgi:hypothetical protein